MKKVATLIRTQAKVLYNGDFLLESGIISFAGDDNIHKYVFTSNAGSTYFNSLDDYHVRGKFYALIN